MTAPPEHLVALAHRAGVMTEYTGFRGDRVSASSESIMAALRSLGVDIDRPEQSADALRELESRKDHQLAEPTIVMTGGEFIAGAGRDVDASALEALLLHGAAEIPLERFGRDGFRCAQRVPVGVYSVRFTLGSSARESTLLVPPARLPAPRERLTGVMLPLYAHRPDPARSLGIASYSNLAELAEWAGRSRADLFGTLPLLSVMLDSPADPSPYSPLSRRRWNELYVDPFATPEAGLARIDPDVSKKLASADLVEYERAWSAGWDQLSRLAKAAFEDESRRTELIAAAQKDPELVEYALYRARRRRGEGVGAAGLAADRWLDDHEARTFLYAQFEADRQLAAAQRRALESGGGLYLDLPVGVAPGGFDVWASPEDYASGFSVGAPPDALFSGGQNWGFRPPHPRAGRRDGHANFRADLAAHFRHCSALRIDHVMMLHRLFWIPEGAGPPDGLYIRYPAEELYAALMIEAHRRGAMVIGENLGVVPEEVNDAMERWGLLGMNVAQFGFGHDASHAIPAPNRHDLACLNTHDTPMFKAFWTGDDLAQNQRYGVIDEETAEHERPGRERVRRAVREALGLPTDADPEGDADAALRGVLERLAESDASALLVTLEDLWGERLPQNVPGAPADRYPSWRRRVDRERAEFPRDPEISSFLERLAAARKRANDREGAAT